MKLVDDALKRSLKLAMKIMPLVVMAFLAAICSAKADPISDIQQANNALARGENDLALELYNNALRPGEVLGETGAIYPGVMTPGFLIIAHTGRGYAQFGLGRLDKAIQDFDKVIAINGNAFEAYNGRGSVHNRKGEWDKALEDFNRALEINPTYTHALNGRANTYSDMGQHDRAIDDYTMVLEYDSQAVFAYQGRGNAYAARQSYDLAIEDFTKALDIDQNFAFALEGRCAARTQTNLLQEALEDCSRAVEFEPENAGFALSLANVYRRLGNRLLATENYTRTLELDPSLQAARDGLSDLSDQ